jgi:hypothetical protein
MSYESVHWSMVNILARIFGLMTGFASLAFGAAAVAQIGQDSLPPSGIGPVAYFVVSFVCLLLAVGFLTVRPYRPDIRRDRPPSAAQAPKLHWWTGAPKE